MVHVWEGRFFRLDAHLDRFTASMTRLRLDPGHDRAAIEDILHGCVRHAGLPGGVRFHDLYARPDASGPP